MLLTKCWILRFTGTCLKFTLRIGFSLCTLLDRVAILLHEHSGIRHVVENCRRKRSHAKSYLSYRNYMAYVIIMHISGTSYKCYSGSSRILSPCTG